MKKFLAVLFISAFVAGSAFAGSSFDLSLSGSVAQKLEASIGSTTAELTLDSTGAGNFTTGDITLISNRKAWHVTLTSTNTWVLKDADDLTIPYKVRIDNGSTNPISWGALTVVNNISAAATPGTKAVSAIAASDYRTPAAGKTFKLYIETNPNLSTFYNFDKPYTDTIAVEIVAN